MSQPTISVVIPSIGRSTLFDAVRSVHAQTYPSKLVEVVVVVDHTAPPGSYELVGEMLDLRPADRVIFVEEPGDSARNIGVAESSGAIVAFLDDDDLWTDDKLERQVSLIEDLLNGGKPFVASSRVHFLSASGEQGSVACPRRCINEGEIVEDYLFRRRSARIDRPSLFTSTLLTDRNTALSVRWDPHLRRHQDWDWLLRATRSGAVLRQSASPLVKIRTGSPNSISGSPDWAASLSWASSQTDWSSETKADFLAAQPLRYALQSRSYNAVTRVVRAIAATHRLPSLSCSLIGAAGIIGRRNLVRAMNATATGRAGRGNADVT